jgi:hypothetical protein
MDDREWPKNRVIVEIVEIENKCPVYKVGRAMGPLMTHIISVAGGVDPSSAEGGVLHYIANPNVPAEKGIHYTQCPMPGKPYSENGPVLFRIKLVGSEEDE